MKKLVTYAGRPAYQEDIEAVRATKKAAFEIYDLCKQFLFDTCPPFLYKEMAELLLEMECEFMPDILALTPPDVSEEDKKAWEMRDIRSTNRVSYIGCKGVLALEDGGRSVMKRDMYEGRSKEYRAVSKNEIVDKDYAIQWGIPFNRELTCVESKYREDAGWWENTWR
jgi:hypothetical protein